MDFETLLPDIIFQAVQEQGYIPTGALFPLNSYENRVYEIGLDSEKPLIAKFYRPNRWSLEQIQEEHLFLKHTFEAEISVILPFSLSHPLQEHTPTLGQIKNFYYTFYPKFGGREKADLNLEERKWLGRSLARLHNVGATLNLQHRKTLTPETYGYDQLAVIDQLPFLPTHIHESLMVHLENAVQLTENFFYPGLLMQPVHGDCHLGNVLWNDSGPTLLDFDDVVIAPVVQDIWMLFHGTPDEIKEQQEAFFEGYETFRPFDYSTLRLTEALRTLRMIHHKAWLARRYQEPIFQKAFPYYTENRYWEEFLLEIKEQISLLEAGL